MSGADAAYILCKEALCRNVFHLADFYKALQDLDLIRAASRLHWIRERLKAQAAGKSNHQDATKTFDDKLCTAEIVVMCERHATEVLRLLTTGCPDSAQQYAGEIAVLLEKEIVCAEVGLL